MAALGGRSAALRPTSWLVAAACVIWTSVATADDGQVFADPTFDGLTERVGVQAGSPLGPAIDLAQGLSQTPPTSLTDDADYLETQVLGGGGNGRLLGFIGRSDDAFYYFISPQSNPLLFEDPRTLSEVRVHFARAHLNLP